jgi:hypothetical protein
VNGIGLQARERTASGRGGKDQPLCTMPIHAHASESGNAGLSNFAYNA